MTVFTSSADLRREIPSGAGSREDRIAAALATLAAEEQRLERMGLVLPLQRCRAQRRYWTFLRAVFALPGSTPMRAPRVFPAHFEWER